MILTACSDGSLRLWDALSGKRIHQPAGPRNFAIFTADWSPDGKYWVSSGQQEQLQLWDAKTRRGIRNIVRHPKAVLSVAFSPDGSRLASASEDRTLAVRDVATGQNSFSILAPTTVRSVAWSPDGQMLASGNADGTVRLYGVKSRLPMKTLYLHNERVSDVCFSPDGSHLLSASFDGTIQKWKIANTLDNLIDVAAGTPNSGRERIAWGPNPGQVAFPLGADIIVRDSLEQPPRRFIGKRDSISDLRWSPDGKAMATTTYKGTAQVWDVASASVTHDLDIQANKTLAVTWAPNGKRIAFAVDDGIAIWDLKTVSEVARVVCGQGSINCVDWNSTGNYLAAAGAQGLVHLYDPDSLEPIGSFADHTNGVSSIRFSPDGTLLASAGVDQIVRIWEVKKGNLLHAMAGHARYIRSLCWSPNGDRLASGGGDSLLRIWNPILGQEVISLSGHTSAIRAIDWSADGRRIATVSWDKTIRVWDASKNFPAQ